MLKAEQIPDAVVKAALLTDERLGMREVIAAAINAWPGMRVSILFPPNTLHVALPLPEKEKFQPYTCTRCLGATENADDICDDCAKETRDE